MVLLGTTAAIVLANLELPDYFAGFFTGVIVSNLWVLVRFAR
jgi:hypothetical protein